MNVKWNGRSYGLDKFTGLHCAAYSVLEECQQHVNFQLPHQNATINYYGFNKSVYKLPPMGQFKYEWEKLRFNSIFLMATITTPFYE